MQSKPEGSTERPTRLDKMERWFRDQPVFSIVILISIVIIGTSEVIQRGSDLLVTVGLVEEKTLQLAADNAKGDFSRKLTELAWRRLFWSRNYAEKVRLKRPQTELDYSWNKHLDTVADWSSDYIVSLNGVEKFYPGSVKETQFQKIHEEFLGLEEELVSLRTDRLDAPDQTQKIAAIQSMADSLNVDLYFFVLNRSPDGK